MIAKTPAPPYYAVIFSSIRTEGDNGYSEMSGRMEKFAAEQDGFLGMESARNALGITVSYWRDQDSIKNWRNHSDHSVARMKGRTDWYQAFKVRIARVERDYDFAGNQALLLKSLKPKLNDGNYVYCSVKDASDIKSGDILFQFKEQEGITLVLSQESADLLGLEYAFVASWITLEVYSSLEAAGLTAMFSKALSNKGISCNVVAAFNHDHLFVKKDDAMKAMAVLNDLSF